MAMLKIRFAQPHDRVLKAQVRDATRAGELQLKVLLTRPPFGRISVQLGGLPLPD